jgi:hypothetical protein
MKRIIKYFSHRYNKGEYWIIYFKSDCFWPEVTFTYEKAKASFPPRSARWLSKHSWGTYWVNHPYSAIDFDQLYNSL